MPAPLLLQCTCLLVNQTHNMTQQMEWKMVRVQCICTAGWSRMTFVSILQRNSWRCIKRPRKHLRRSTASLRQKLRRSVGTLLLLSTNKGTTHDFIIPGATRRSPNTWMQHGDRRNKRASSSNCDPFTSKFLFWRFTVINQTPHVYMRVDYYILHERVINTMKFRRNDYKKYLCFQAFLFCTFWFVSTKAEELVSFGQCKPKRASLLRSM